AQSADGTFLDRLRKVGRGMIQRIERSRVVFELDAHSLWVQRSSNDDGVFALVIVTIGGDVGQMLLDGKLEIVQRFDRDPMCTSKFSQGIQSAATVGRFVGEN